MDSINGQDVLVILSIKHGRGFGHLNVTPGVGTLIEATLNGSVLDTDVVPLISEPLFDTELMWESDKKSLRRLRTGSAAIKIQCFIVGQPEAKQIPIGHFIINLRQAHIAPSGSSHMVIGDSWWQWQKLIGAKSPAPELLCCLRIEEKPKTPEKHIPQAVRDINLKHNQQIQPMLRVYNPNLVTRLHTDKGVIQIGSDETAVDRFILTIFVGQAVHLDLLIPGNYTKTIATKNEPLYFHYNLLDYDINTAKISMDDIYNPISLNEKMVVTLCSSLENLHQYFSSSSKLVMKLLIGNDVVGFTDLSLQGLIPSTDKVKFCSSNAENTVTIESPCFLRGFRTRIVPTAPSGLQPYIYLKAQLKYQGSEQKNVSNNQVEAECKQTETHSKLQRSLTYSILDVPTQANCSGTEPNDNNNESGELLSTVIHQSTETVGKTVDEHVPAANLKDVSQDETELRLVSKETEVLQKDKHFKNISAFSNDVGLKLCDSSTQTPEESTKPYHAYILKISLEKVVFYQLPPQRRFCFRFHHPKAEIICSSHPEIVIEDVHKSIGLQNINCSLRFASLPEEINHYLSTWSPEIRVYNTDGSHFNQIANTTLNTGFLIEEHMRQCCYDLQLTDVRTREVVGVLTVRMALEDNGQQFETDTALLVDVRKHYLHGQGPVPEVIDDQLIYKAVEEIEDWKEKQKELFRAQLKKKEQAYYSALCEKWKERRLQLEKNLSCSVQQCKTLAQSLNDTTEELRVKVYNNVEKERELNRYKDTIEQQHRLKVMELKELARRVQDDLSLQVSKLERMNEELKENNKKVLKENTLLKETVKSLECDLDTLKKTSLTKDQITSVLQELKSAEEKLELALKSKSFFKEQWARAVREIHRIKSEQQEAIQIQIRHSKEELKNLGLQHLLSENDNEIQEDQSEIQQIKMQMNTIRTNHGFGDAGQQYSYVAQPVTLNPISSHPPDIRKMSSNSSLNKPSSSSLHREQNEHKIKALVEERDRLMNTGSYTLEDEVISQINQNIQSLLVHSENNN